MNELLKQRMIELFMTRKISSSLIYKYISTEFKTITKKEFFNILVKLTKTKEIIRRKSDYRIKCKCCNEYIPNKEMIGIYCERCSFLGLVTSIHSRIKKYDRDEYDEEY